MTTPSDVPIEITRVMNEFQRNARAMLEQLLPALHHKSLYPDAAVDGWGDARGGVSTASTVVLKSPKWLKPDHGTKQLALLRLARTAGGEWTLLVSVVAQPDRQIEWPPRRTESAWWTELREQLRAQILAYHASKP